MVSLEPPHVADASVVINLNASGSAKEILRAFPAHLAVVDVVLQELEFGRPKGRQDAALLHGLIDEGIVNLVRLDADAEEYFERLVIGAAESTLDDGEAATIAYAVQQDAVAVIDERKATRLCAELFPGILVRTTLDIFAHANVQAELGEIGLADAMFRALQQGRMRVSAQHGGWVVGRIGAERAKLCPSLPALLRSSTASS